MEDPPPLLIFPLRCAVARASFRPVAKLPTEEAWCRFGAALRVVAELVAVAAAHCGAVFGPVAGLAAAQALACARRLNTILGPVSNLAAAEAHVI